jgi:S1-C subfamily serine protease
MDELLLIDAIERFLKGDMLPEEQNLFEELRKNNADVDQMVVEYTFFLNEINQYGKSKTFRQHLSEIEKEFKGKNILTGTKSSEKTTPPSLWLRNKKNLAIAASFIGIIFFLTAIIIYVINSGNEKKIKPLVEKLNQQENKTRQIENKVNQLTNSSEKIAPRLEARFRATGFMIDASNAYIITNAHVVKEAKNKLIIENNKGVQYNAKAIYLNTLTDIAILKVTDSDFKKMPSIPYSIKRNSCDLGEQIFLLGYPKQEIVYGEGYISAMNGYEMDTIFYQLSTPANEGNSGSPVVNKKGELLGVLSSMETNAQGVVFAIKSENIFKAVDETRKIDAYKNISIQPKPALKGLDRTAQIKRLQDYIFMVKGN